MVYYNETIFGKVHRVSRKIGGNPFKRSQKNFGIFEKIITWWALQYWDIDISSGPWSLVK